MRRVLSAWGGVVRMERGLCAALLCLLSLLPVTSRIQAEEAPSPLHREESVVTRVTEALRSRLTVHGYVRNETAFRVVKPVAFSKVLNILNVEPRYMMTPTASLSARIRGFYDAVYDFEDVDTINPRRGPQTVLTENLTDPDQIFALSPGNVGGVEVDKAGLLLKELYMDLRFPQLDLRIGKQIVRWGVVEGSRVTDEINALDFREFILRDVSDRYIPTWMLKADYYFDHVSVELLSIPDLEFHKPALKRTEWEQFQILPGLGRPPQTLKNTEWALKVTYPVRGWEVSHSIFYTWDDFPAAFRNLSEFGFLELFLGPPGQSVVLFKPRYTRLTILGATLSGPVGRVVVNAEAAYVFNKFFGTRFGQLRPGQIVLGIGEVQRDYVKYAVGLDATIQGTDLSFQILQHVIPAWESIMIQDRFDTVLTLFARKELSHGAVVPQLLVLYFVNNDEWLIRPRSDYRLTDRILLTFGADIMQGRIGRPLPGEFNFVGFFTNSDRIYMEAQYSF